MLTTRWVKALKACLNSTPTLSPFSVCLPFREIINSFFVSSWVQIYLLPPANNAVLSDILTNVSAGPWSIFTAKEFLTFFTNTRLSLFFLETKIYFDFFSFLFKLTWDKMKRVIHLFEADVDLCIFLKLSCNMIGHFKKYLSNSRIR